jgi:adenosylcobinamide-phosphate synthase
MFLELALVAAVIEAAVGYPDALYRRIGHPVTWIARLIAWADKAWNSDQDSDVQQRTLGIALLLLLLAVSLLIGLIVTRLLFHLLPWFLAFPLLAVIASSLPAQRSLHTHVLAVADALQARGLEAGRTAVGAIVGRDTGAMDEAAVVRAAIESLAESFSDGIVAPLFWMAVGGLSGAIAYKAVNTADSMVGHKTERYLAFGWAAARTDDLVNLPASRLSALWLVLASLGQAGLSPSGAVSTVRRDARLHESPNAGWPEAAMAGALGIRLGGPRSYEGQAVDAAWLGGGRRDVTVRDLRAALGLYRRACALQIVVLAVLAVLIWLL